MSKLFIQVTDVRSGEPIIDMNYLKQFINIQFVQLEYDFDTDKQESTINYRNYGARSC